MSAQPHRPGRIVAVLGHGVVPAHAPILRADDLGALRGDGIFETMHVRGGAAWMLDAHLDRMAASAARLDLDLPGGEALAGLAAQALAAWPAQVEGVLRMVCTRGAEEGGPVTVYATVAPIAEAVLRGRRQGISVATASIGLAADARQRAPWLLGGAKTLSYAVNMASQRWALAHGADDVLWTSSDGYALEGPTSTLVWLDGRTLCTVPAATTGILAGTTARHLLDRAAELGWTAEERMVTPDELADVDGVWFTSSVRGVAEVTAIDEVKLLPSDVTRAVRELLGFA